MSMEEYPKVSGNYNLIDGTKGEGLTQDVPKIIQFIRTYIQYIQFFTNFLQMAQNGFTFLGCHSPSMSIIYPPRLMFFRGHNHSSPTRE